MYTLQTHTYGQRGETGSLKLVLAPLNVSWGVEMYGIQLGAPLKTGKSIGGIGNAGERIRD